MIWNAYQFGDKKHVHVSPSRVLYWALHGTYGGQLHVELNLEGEAISHAWPRIKICMLA